MRKDLTRALSEYPFFRRCAIGSDVPPGFDVIVTDLAVRLGRIKVLSDETLSIRSILLEERGILKINWILRESVSARVEQQLSDIFKAAIQTSRSTCHVCGSSEAELRDDESFARCAVHRFVSPTALRDFADELVGPKAEETEFQLRRVLLEDGGEPRRGSPAFDIEIAHPRWLRRSTTAAIVASCTGDDIESDETVRGIERLLESAHSYGVSKASQLAGAHYLVAARMDRWKTAGVPSKLARAFLRVNNLDLTTDLAMDSGHLDPVSLVGAISDSLVTLDTGART
jgi:hypothetical protein